ncbi:MAG TPA: hypothetical protein VHD32_11575 [Candidatus Didemnitutus sp.]|nr:hypothetical protein [Candidatus Didemnitutus sp.]
MRLLRIAGLAGLLALAADVSAAQPEATPAWGSISFTRGLSGEDVAAAGLTKLSADQITFLNSLVAREVSLAHAGGVTSFAGTFSGRRTAAEKSKAGLDLLTDNERARLDLLVAQAIVAGPVVATAERTWGNRLSAFADRLEIHGEVSFTVGTSGHGRNFYGTSFFTTISDPASGVTVGIGFDQYHGKGIPACSYYGGPGYLDYDVMSPMRLISGPDYQLVRR